MNPPQNSLYSHLNRVHGVKKDMLQDMQLQMVQQPQQNSSGSATGQPAADNNGSSSSSSAQPQTAPAAASDGGSNNHEGIMDLAHHSDNSN